MFAFDLDARRRALDVCQIRRGQDDIAAAQVLLKPVRLGGAGNGRGGGLFFLGYALFETPSEPRIAVHS